jgi:hypothetical protein
MPSRLSTNFGNFHRSAKMATAAPSRSATMASTNTTATEGAVPDFDPNSVRASLCVYA